MNGQQMDGVARAVATDGSSILTFAAVTFPVVAIAADSFASNY